MKRCWLDLRGTELPRDALLAEAIHHRVDGVLAADPADLAGLPPTLTRVLFPASGTLPDRVEPADLVILPGDAPAPPSTVEIGAYVEVTDPESLELACRCARTRPWTVLSFRDPTRIPLEIVLAAADGAGGGIVTVATDPAEAEVILGVLEHGPDGVLMAPRALGDAARLKTATLPRTGDLSLVELEVTRVAHAGMGERACVDTCSQLGPDEGLLVGSRARGLVLCASETHPLPYMPTRPFRINAGAIMSYTLGAGGRTRYLSELHAGAEVLAVTADGRTRVVTVGRVKIETRPLLAIDAVAKDGREVNLIVQDDWHVRVLGPAGALLNSTALRPGDVVLGHLPERDRHVGYPIDELCHEQ